MFNFNAVSYVNNSWSSIIVSLCRSTCRNSRYQSQRFLCSAKKAETPSKKPTEQQNKDDNIIDVEIASIKECKTPPEVSDYNEYSNLILSINKTHVHYHGTLTVFFYIPRHRSNFSFISKTLHEKALVLLI